PPMAIEAAKPPNPPAVPRRIPSSTVSAGSVQTNHSVALTGAAKTILAAEAASMSLFSDVSGNFDRDHLVRIDDRLTALDLVDIFHAFDDLTPDRILAVQEARIAEADEELRIGAVRILGASHGSG